ncbi:hypothetical protein niasHT_030152 [Heterodera trifolii]|uniref:Uncharacterized protein n=1 Tax=Heterodera trifolii TaxID=157864 RepID=A0ABD2K2Q1_9BILA
MDFFPPQLPSTSSAYSATTDPPKFELRCEKYVAKIFFAERKFIELKTGKYYQARKAQIEKRRESVRKRICPHFLRLKSAIDDEYNAKKKKLDTVRSLRLRAAERCREAELSAARLNLHELETTVVRQQCERMVEGKMEQLKAETEAVEEILRHEICNSNLTKSNDGKSHDVSNGQKTPMNNYLVECEAPNDPTEEGTRNPKKQWRNVPAMIAQLPSHCIHDDLTKIYSG